ncbi:MAG: hypothetical protein GXP54_02665, partial [Deltaproteobacteria bacterium]|nr:hypothetical protein [Deltaproteobacteria bacterium]
AFDSGNDVGKWDVPWGPFDTGPWTNDINDVFDASEAYLDESPGLDVPDSLSDPGAQDSGIDDSGIEDPGPNDPGPADTGWDLVDAWGSDVHYTGRYAGMEDLEGQALVDKLCQLVKKGYKGVSYDDAKDISLDFAYNFGGKVRAVYKGDWVNGGKGLNQEHTWPQSKGAGSGDAKSDLFHLFPTHPTFNSVRGNLTFGVVDVKDWPESGYEGDPDCTDHFPGHPLGCFSVRGWDDQGVKVFEPRDGHKGDAARAVLYFSIRYGSDCKVKSLSVFDSIHPDTTESLLKTWNTLDPPDADERTRNDRIETIENVRNPFIDHPEFADRIDFH